VVLPGSSDNRLNLHVSGTSIVLAPALGGERSACATRTGRAFRRGMGHRRRRRLAAETQALARQIYVRLPSRPSAAVIRGRLRASTPAM